MQATYLPRVLDGQLKDYLDAFGAVWIKGPKWCGKTTTAEQQARSVLRLQDPDHSAEHLQMAGFMPSRLLEGETPRLLDEWQMAPVLWDAVRMAVDKRGATGQFILTGSTTVDSRQLMHTGTGRIASLKMYPMSLYESKESNGTVSLGGLLKDPESFPDAKSDLDIPGLAFAICRGGWPAGVGKTPASALLIARSYVDSICSVDTDRMNVTVGRPHRIRALLQSYARNVSTLAANTTILEDVKANDAEMTEATMYSYLSMLSRLFVIENVPAWNPAIRSASAIRSSDKKEFIDPSIGTASMGLTPEMLMNDVRTFGFFFECLAIRDLRVYSHALAASVHYYRDRYGLECDAVLRLGNGEYALIEIKLGGAMIESGAGNLLKLDGLIKEHGIRPPRLLMILTGGEYAYRRKDGIFVVPIGCLKD